MEVWEYCIQLNIFLMATHLLGTLIVEADFLSRGGASQVGDQPMISDPNSVGVNQTEGFTTWYHKKCKDSVSRGWSSQDALNIY